MKETYFSKRKILAAIQKETDVSFGPGSLLMVKTMCNLGNRIMAGEFDVVKDVAEKEVKVQEKSCETCGHRSPIFGLSRFCFRCKDHNFWGGVVKHENETPSEYNHINDRINSLDFERRKHAGMINIIDRKTDELDVQVKALEDQHRDIGAIPEEYEVVGFSSMYGKLYAKTEHKG